MRLNYNIIDAARAQHMAKETSHFNEWVEAAKKCTCPASRSKGLQSLYRVIRSGMKSDWHETKCPMWYREPTRPEFS